MIVISDAPAQFRLHASISANGKYRITKTLKLLPLSHEIAYCVRCERALRGLYDMGGQPRARLYVSRNFCVEQ